MELQIYIVMECLKHRFNQGKEGNVYFYRDSNGQEVDILVKEEGQLTAIEVKSSMTYHPDFAKSLKRLPENAGNTENKQRKSFFITYRLDCLEFCLQRYDIFLKFTKIRYFFEIMRMFFNYAVYDNALSKKS